MLGSGASGNLSPDLYVNDVSTIFEFEYLIAENLA